MFQALPYLSPVAGLPFGTAAAATAPLSAGFGGQSLAVLLRDDQAGRGEAADFTRPEPSSAGSRALQDGRNERVKLLFFFSFFPRF